MNCLFSSSVSNKFLLLVFIDKGTHDRVEIALLPVHLSGFSPENFIIERGLLVMVLKVAIGHYIVVSLCWHLHCFTANAIFSCRLRSLAWRLEMMVFGINVADDVVVSIVVLAWSEVPRLLLGVIRAAFETLQLIVKVENIVRLLIAK